jgi:hypothetical protein
MSGFLARWAKLKAAAQSQPAEAVPEVAEASLPAPESLTAESDIRAFLAAGVSPSLQSRALRVAWESDAQIAAFRGMAEYDWDFNAEGYGRLAAGDDVAALVRGVVEKLAEQQEPPPPLAGGGWGEGLVRQDVSACIGDTDALPLSVDLAASTPPPAVDPLRGSTPQREGEKLFRRRHGGALPA